MVEKETQQRGGLSLFLSMLATEWMNECGTEGETKTHVALQAQQDAERVWIRLACTARTAHPQELMTHINRPSNSPWPLLSPSNTRQGNTGLPPKTRKHSFSRMPLLRDFLVSGCWVHGDSCRAMAVRREGTPGVLGVWHPGLSRAGGWVPVTTLDLARGLLMSAEVQ